jgi:hypothetical protein
MALWNNKDTEGSKPSWLTEEQKRQCFRTIRGWEIPLAGQGFTNTAENIFGATSVDDTTTAFLYRSGNFVGMTELLVAMPMDASSTGVTNDNLAGYPNNEKRGEVSAFNGTAGATGTYGLTQSGDSPNYKPYFTAPASGITNTAPGTVVYATRGITSYIPVIASDANYTDLPKFFVFSLTTSSGTQSLTGVSLVTSFTAAAFSSLYNVMGATPGTTPLTGTTLATRQNLVFNQPTAVVGMTAPAAYWDVSTAAAYIVNRYGGWGGITQGAAILQVGSSAVTGNYGLRLQVFDGRTPTGSGATGTVDFTLTLTSGTSF